MDEVLGGILELRLTSRLPGWHVKVTAREGHPGWMHVTLTSESRSTAHLVQVPSTPESWQDLEDWVSDQAALPGPEELHAPAPVHHGNGDGKDRGDGDDDDEDNDGDHDGPKRRGYVNAPGRPAVLPDGVPDAEGTAPQAGADHH